MIMIVGEPIKTDADSETVEIYIIRILLYIDVSRIQHRSLNVTQIMAETDLHVPVSPTFCLIRQVCSTITDIPIVKSGLMIVMPALNNLHFLVT